MSPESKPSVHALSMREKLDALAREREVLIALRDLARSGLHEGDTLTHRTEGKQGRLLVQRTGPSAGIMIQTTDGERCPYSSEWIGRSATQRSTQ